MCVYACTTQLTNVWVVQVLHDSNFTEQLAMREIERDRLSSHKCRHVHTHTHSHTHTHMHHRSTEATNMLKVLSGTLKYILCGCLQCALIAYFQVMYIPFVSCRGSIESFQWSWWPPKMSTCKQTTFTHRYTIHHKSESPHMNTSIRRKAKQVCYGGHCTDIIKYYRNSLLVQLACASLVWPWQSSPSRLSSTVCTFQCRPHLHLNGRNVMSSHRSGGAHEKVLTGASDRMKGRDVSLGHVPGKAENGCNSPRATNVEEKGTDWGSSSEETCLPCTVLSQGQTVKSSHAFIQLYSNYSSVFNYYWSSSVPLTTDSKRNTGCTEP